MTRFDVFVIMLVLYLGLSAWAYRDVGVKRARKTEAEPAHAPVHDSVRAAQRHRTQASFWQIVLSVGAICVGVVLVTGGAGLVVRGLFGSAQWVLLTLGEGLPVNDVVTGLIVALLGVLIVYETRYSIIKHPRPPRSFRHRPV